MKKSRYQLIFFILVFIAFQVSFIVNDFASTRIIEVRKEIYENNEKDYLKEYDIGDAPYEQFDIEVTPKSFLDYLFLTNKKGNLLSIILKIVAGCCLAWYILKLQPDNFFSEKNSRWAINAFIIYGASFIALSFGIDHTKDFWKSIYSYKGRTDFWKYNFYVETKNNFLIYFWIFFIFMTFFEELVAYNKPATIKLNDSEENES